MGYSQDSWPGTSKPPLRVYNVCWIPCKCSYWHKYHSLFYGWVARLLSCRFVLSFHFYNHLQSRGLIDPLSSCDRGSFDPSIVNNEQAISFTNIEQSHYIHPNRPVTFLLTTSYTQSACSHQARSQTTSRLLYTNRARFETIELINKLLRLGRILLRVNSLLDGLERHDWEAYGTSKELIVRCDQPSMQTTNYQGSDSPQSR